mgnify:CR=1 FL=1
MNEPRLFDSIMRGLGFVPFVDGRQTLHVITNVPPIAGVKADTIRPVRLLTISSELDHVSGQAHGAVGAGQVDRSAGASDGQGGPAVPRDGGALPVDQGVLDRHLPDAALDGRQGERRGAGDE